MSRSIFLTNFTGYSQFFFSFFSINSRKGNSSWSATSSEAKLKRIFHSTSFLFRSYIPLKWSRGAASFYGVRFFGGNSPNFSFVIFVSPRIHRSSPCIPQKASWKHSGHPLWCTRTHEIGTNRRVMCMFTCTTLRKGFYEFDHCVPSDLHPPEIIRHKDINRLCILRKPTHWNYSSLYSWSTSISTLPNFKKTWFIFGFMSSPTSLWVFRQLCFHKISFSVYHLIRCR